MRQPLERVLVRQLELELELARELGLVQEQQLLVLQWRHRSLRQLLQVSRWRRASTARWSHFSRRVRLCHCASCLRIARLQQLPRQLKPTPLPLC